MITPLWKIETLWVQKIDGNLQDVVVTAAWRCSATQDGFTGSVYATVSFQAPAASDFTPFEDLTQEQVLGWVWTNGVDKNAAEEAVAQQINNQINPPVVILPLPWVPPVPPPVPPPEPEMIVPPMLPQVTPEIVVQNDASELPAA